MVIIKLLQETETQSIFTSSLTNNTNCYSRCLTRLANNRLLKFSFKGLLKESVHFLQEKRRNQFIIWGACCRSVYWIFAASSLVTVFWLRFVPSCNPARQQIGLVCAPGISRRPGGGGSHHRSPLKRALTLTAIPSRPDMILHIL